MLKVIETAWKRAVSYSCVKKEYSFSYLGENVVCTFFKLKVAMHGITSSEHAPTCRGDDIIDNLTSPFGPCAGLNRQKLQT